MNEQRFFIDGWCRFTADPAISRWVRSVLPAARAARVDPAHARWLRCGGTWFAGVNALENDARGAVHDGPPLAGGALDFIARVYGPPEQGWDRAQVSVIHPGYPQPMDGESAGAFRYRREHDAAHVDGLLREGPHRRRRLREHHAFILGIPLVETSGAASPPVVWEGSHEMVRAAFRARLADLPPARWADEDVTETYHAVRRDVFRRCRRRIIDAGPGEAFLLHRLVLHGMSPWGAGATATTDGRMIAYFRPDLGNAAAWLDAP